MYFITMFYTVQKLAYYADAAFTVRANTHEGHACYNIISTILCLSVIMNVGN